MGQETKGGGSVPSEKFIDFYREMYLIRRVEEKIVEVYPEQEIRCPTHLSIGQEAAAVGVCQALNDSDHVYSTHRCHSHYLAKGGDLRAMMAELYGRGNGCSRGKGGSMHLVDARVGMMGASAIVGGTIPLAVGSALSFQMEGKKNAGVAFFGDGASEQGVFYESMLFASLRKLPVIFACENNFYATYSSFTARQPTDNVYEKAKMCGMAGVRVDGNDVLEVYAAAREAVARAREGGGPTLIESLTYRWRDHVGPNYDIEVGYRSQKELDEWMARCPIERLASLMRDEGVAQEKELKEVRDQVEEKIEEAFEHARNSPFPEVAEMHEDVY